MMKFAKQLMLTVILIIQNQYLCVMQYVCAADMQVYSMQVHLHSIYVPK